MLKLEQVHTFLRVAHHLQIDKAADDLLINQSTVNASIAKLETQLGLSLFQRIGSRVQLTEAGSLLQKEGQLLLEKAQRLEHDLADYSGLETGTLLLGASFTVGNYWLPYHLARFRNRYPAIHVQCELGNAQAVLDGLNAGRFDLGFLTGRPPAGATTVVGSESLSLVVGRHHPWFGKAPRKVHNLLETPWLIREPGSGTRQMLESWLRQVGLGIHQLTIHQELRSNEMVKTMVDSVTALGALPSSMVKREIDTDLLWPINPLDCALQAEPIWMVPSPTRQNSQLLNQFVALIQAGEEGLLTGLHQS
ncbi:MAG: LysR family transcriptional regulator [Cyanobacteriota bacterium]